MSQELKSFTKKLSSLQPINLNYYKQILQDEFVELSLMSECPQDSLWHSEGDVLTHTQMVMDKTLEEVSSNNVLSYKNKISIYLAALLHDIGKPSSTYVTPNGRVFSPSHATIGLPLAKKILHLLKVPYDMRTQVLRLILRHMATYRMANRMVQNLTFNGINVEYKKYFRLASELNLPSLYSLTRADWLGRMAPDKEKILELIETFRSRATYYSLWAYSYENLLETVISLEDLFRLGVKDSKEQKRVQYWLFHLFLKGRLQTKEQIFQYINTNKDLLSPKSAHLYIMIGVPGSGKSTWVENNLPDAQTVSSDKKREELFNDVSCQSDNKKVFQQCHFDLRQALAAGKKVAFDATNTKLNYRNLAMQLAFEYFAHTTIVYFDLPLEVALERNKQRLRQVSESIITRFFNELEMPHFTEAQDLIVISLASDPIWS